MTTTTSLTSSIRRIGTLVLRHRFQILALVDAVLWAVVLPLAAFARFDFDWSRVDPSGVFLAVVIAIVVHLAVGFSTGLYLGRRKMASFEEIGWVAGAAAAAVLALFVALAVLPGRNLAPRGAILAAGAYEIVGALSFRYLVRTLMENRRKATHPRRGRVLIYGAGNAGEQAVKALREDPESDLLPVAFLDDDPSKSRLRLLGIPIEGGRDAIGLAAAKHEAGVLLIAIPSARQETVLEIAEEAQAHGLAVRVLPRLEKFLTEPVAVKDIRELTLADFLSREEVRLDLEKIAGYLENKVVLVTGAGGSIGSQLCETVREFAPARLLMLDHAENSLHRLQLRLEGRALLTSPDLILCDIRDREGLRAVFAEHRPDVVFHAAAHKHVTFLERHPAEAVKTNVAGTENVLAAAVEFGVERFVNVSTDKAADPVNVLGLTKRLGERLTAHYARLGGGVFISVRFGNVLGSDGSVIPTFREQIARGEPITVTHPDVTRYFMTIPEAVQLVVEAGALGEDGDVLVLEMGEPVKIVELATRLAAEISPGVRPEIVFTGLREGEKLHECLVSERDEMLDRPHELLQRGRVPPIDPDLLAVALVGDGPELVARLRKVLDEERVAAPTE
jgi:FlaA1/EpsC-like NDP-sugar epimerase